MRLRGFISREQAGAIHSAALRVLEEVGVRVEHARVRERLCAGGAKEMGGERVAIPARRMETFIARAKKDPPRQGPPRIGCHVEVYRDKYLDPESGELGDFDEERLFRYFGLARTLESVNSLVMIGLPYVPEGLNARVLPLAEKLYCWKMGFEPSGSVHLTELCEPLLEIYDCHAAHAGKALQDVFNATGYLISPLRLARGECEQMLFFAEKGLRMHIGNMPSIGSTCPASGAGAAVQTLAEQLFLCFLADSFWGDARLWIHSSALGMNMRLAVPSFGRPEQQRVNMIFAGLAEFYGIGAGGLAGLTDAASPSFEAGLQKATGVLVTALVNGYSSISAGLLAVDKICSPVQMVLDDDAARALDALLAEERVDEDDLAVGEIAQAAESGNFLESEFTAARLRTGYFVPRTWADGPDRAWLDGAKTKDADKARDIVLKFNAAFEPSSEISDVEEKELNAIIRRQADRMEA